MDLLGCTFLSYVLFSCLNSVLGLECYVCHRQDANDEKCLRSLQTCNPHEDMCLTEISWGTTPYWQAGAQKQYYVSKRCATKKQCEKAISKTMEFCTHIWYEDWRCTECCPGDRCNYYIISGSRNVVPSSLFILLGLAFKFISAH